MELVNKSVKNAIQFILCVQDSCDKHRKCMENVWLQEYTLFVYEWKQNQTELRKQAENTINSSLLKDSRKDYSCSNDDLEKLEELTLADSLLRKARNIRIKGQKTINGVVECKNSSASIADSGDVIKKSTISSCVLEKNKSTKRLPQSKSDLTLKMYSHKSTVVPRSKSVNVPLVPKADKKSCHRNKNGASVSSKFDATNDIKSSGKTEAVTVISSKDLNVLKTLHVSLPICNELKSKKVTSTSDSSEDKNQCQVLPYPSSREFINIMKERLTATTHIKLKLWYPFLNPKSEKFLTAVECNNFCSIKKICSILYNIQEVMMWLDLLYLVERQIYPTLIFDAKDVNSLRICSYLLSLFNPSSQRIPILNPNR